MNKSKHFSGHPIMKQILNLIPPSIITRTAEKHQSDRYYKRFKTKEHMITMLYAVLSGVSSLRELTTVFLACEGKISHLNMDYFPKRSTLSDANKNRSSEVFADIYADLLKRYSGVLSDSGIKLPIQHLKIVDSTTISLFSDVLKGVGRDPINGKKKGGIKMHTMINALEDVPSLVRFTSAATHDSVFLKELNLKKGSVVVFDKAYNDYNQYFKWILEGVTFVTRQKDNAKYQSIEEFELADLTSDQVLKDEKIIVQKDSKSISLRRIAYWDMEKEKLFEFISNNFDLEPDTIAQIYKKRWQIEVLFKRLKQNFPLKYFLGDNQNAIEIQIWCALILQILMLVIKRNVMRRWAFSNMISMVRLHLMTYIDLTKFLENPEQKWIQLTTKPPNNQLKLIL